MVLNLLALSACVTGTIEIGDPVGDSGVTATDSGETDADTDADADSDTDADSDADADADSDTDTDAAVCDEYPFEDFYSDAEVEGEGWDPYWLSIGFAATVGDDTLQDMMWSGDIVSSYLTFNLFTEDASQSCGIYYDLSESVRSSQAWFTDTGGALFDAWDLSLRDALTDCPPVSADKWGTRDLRTMLEQHTWGFAIGEAVRVEDYFRDVVDDFEVWDPYLMGGYVMTSAYSPDTAFEVSYALSFEAECGLAQTDFDGNPVYREAVAEGPLPDGIGYAAGLYGLTLENLR